MDCEGEGGNLKRVGLGVVVLIILWGTCSITKDHANDPQITALSTASVFLLPMQQDTKVFVVSTMNMKVRASPHGTILAYLNRYEQIVANCTRDEPGWCQIVEGVLKSGYFWQGCTNKPGGHDVSSECSIQD